MEIILSKICQICIYDLIKDCELNKVNRLYRNLNIFFRISILIASLIFLIQTIDINKLKSTFENINIVPLVICIIIYLFTQIVSAQRFVYISKTLGFDVNLQNSTKIHFIGLWFNNFLPSGLGGDAVKAGLFKNQMGLGVAIRATLLDRVFGMIFMLLVILIFSPIYILYFENKQISILIPFLSFIILVLILIMMQLSHYYQDNKQIIILEWIKSLFLDLIKFLNIKKIFEQFWVSGIIHLNGIIAYYLIGESLGINLDFIGYFLIVPVIFFTALIPISFAGWGIRELIAIYLFSLVGVSNAKVLETSILFGLHALIASVVLTTSQVNL